MRQILVLGLGHLSNGEITIAVETLRQLPAEEFNLLFLSHKEGAKYIRSLGIQAEGLNNTDPVKNKEEFKELVARWKPDMIICADIYTMDYASTWSGFDFAYLNTLGLPIGSFDQYEWESTSFTWDIMGSAGMRMKESLITDCDLLIRPCPLNKPVSLEKRIITCRLFDQDLGLPFRDKNSWYQELDIPADKKVVFTVNSNWEYINISKSKQVKRMREWMPRFIYEYLAATGVPLVVLHVGPKPWDFPVDKLDYRYFPGLESSLYRDSIYYSDLFCGTNAISITLSSAVYSQTPVVLFQNLKRLDFDLLKGIIHQMPPWYRRMADEVEQAFSIRVFPWGWKNFLEPVFRNNMYTETFFTAPILEPKKCIQILNSVLTGQERREKLCRKQRKYFELLAGLRPLHENLISFF